MAAAMVASHAVFMGNLRSDVHVGALKQSIIHLLHQISVSVTKHNIDIHNKPHSVFAFVHLSSEQEAELVLDLLNTQQVLNSVDLSGIVKDGRKFKVAPKLERWQLTSEGSAMIGSHQSRLLVQPQHNLKASSYAASSQWGDKSPNGSRAKPSLDVVNLINSSHQQPATDARKTYTVFDNKPAAAENHYYVKREKCGTPLFSSILKNRSHYGLVNSEMDMKGKVTFSNGEKGDDELDSDDDVVVPNSKKFKRRNNQRKKRLGSAKLQKSGNVFDLGELKRGGTLDASGGDFTPNGSAASKDNAPFYHRDVYMLDEVLGNESRMLEFKRGHGMYVHRQLADHVAVYTCAFLNSEGGTLLVGVNDDGEVKGVDIDRPLEDRLRIAIDQTVARISPAVFPSMYCVQFVPVTDVHNQTLGDRKVLEVGMLPGTSGQLYQTPAGDVYVRRDGSVQGPLRANDIQEWTRMMLHEEQRKKDNEIANLREKEKQLTAELVERRANEDKLTSMLKRESTELAQSTVIPTDKSKDKSKVCIIV